MIAPILACLFLIITFFLTALSSALRRLERRDSKKQRIALGKRFLYKCFFQFLSKGKELEEWLFSILCAQFFARFAFAGFSLAAFFEFYSSVQPLSLGPYETGNISLVIAFFVYLIFSFFIGDYLPRIFGLRKPDLAIQVSAPLSSFFVLLIFPITYLFLRFSKSFYAVYFDLLNEPQELAKEEILEIIQEANFTPTIDSHEKKLIESVLSFRDRIVREVMVPRVNVFSLSCTTTVREAARLLLEEGYSRTPVYRNTVDNIVGVLMYKDVLTKYMEYEQSGNDPTLLDMPIETIQKSVLYAPETKKISHLLQEFRKRQMHLAIVVDEYGGTEGIVTIEDILEEIVGEIADEYDEETALFIPQSDGAWIVDARMSIFDAEEKLGVDIPQEGDYDTIGGYIFHRTGAIPSKGFIIHHDVFEMEVLRSNDRCVEKVKIKPIKG